MSEVGRPNRDPQSGQCRLTPTTPFGYGNRPTARVANRLPDELPAERWLRYVA